jgi:transposase
MDVLYDCCCGLDVHRDTVVACLLRAGAGGRPTKAVRTFGTTTAALGELAVWLGEASCTHVAMESTGVYWKPVYNMLDGRCTVVVVNAAHVKAVPGRKTDVHDSEWLAELLRHGLLRASFIPDQAQRELRDLTRTRTTLTDERSAVVCRIHGVLEDANVKLAGVATDLMGVSGRAILAALVAGETDPTVLAALARGKLRRKQAALGEALAGGVAAHQRQLLALHLAHVDFLDGQIAELSATIAERLQAHAADLARLTTIPGVGTRTAEVLLAELGTDMSRFESAGKCAAWTGLAPGNYESAGKRKGGKTRKGSKWLRRALVEAARAAARTQHTYLASVYRRLVGRRGPRQAAVAVAHKILVIAYYLLLRHETYQDYSPPPADDHRRDQTRRRAVAQLQALGFQVTLTATEPAA